MQGCAGGERRPPATDQDQHQQTPAPPPPAIDQAQFEADKRAVYKYVYTFGYITGFSFCP